MYKFRWPLCTVPILLSWMIRNLRTSNIVNKTHTQTNTERVTYLHQPHSFLVCFGHRFIHCSSNQRYICWIICRRQVFIECVTTLNIVMNTSVFRQVNPWDLFLSQTHSQYTPYIDAVNFAIPFILIAIIYDVTRKPYTFQQSTIISSVCQCHQNSIYQQVKVKV